MSRIPLVVHRIPFTTELGADAPAYRPYVTARFIGLRGRRIEFSTFIDSGSPYSVIPFRLAKQVLWSDLGSELLLGTTSQPVTWQDIPCRMGELEVELGDSALQVWTPPLRVLAKVATQRAAPALVRSAILGMNFVVDNRALFELDATGPTFSGQVLVS